jgi:hypothetical protein
MFPGASAAGRQVRLRIGAGQGGTDQQEAEDPQKQECGCPVHLRSVYYGAWQAKFEASSMLPEPLYFATCG